MLLATHHTQSTIKFVITHFQYNVFMRVNLMNAISKGLLERSHSKQSPQSTFDQRRMSSSKEEQLQYKIDSNQRKESIIKEWSKHKNEYGGDTNGKQQQSSRPTTSSATMLQYIPPVYMQNIISAVKRPQCKCEESNYFLIDVARTFETRKQNNDSPFMLNQRLTDLRCKKGDCRRAPFRREVCKRHFQRAVRLELRKQFRNLYRAADKAYSSMDFTGIGSITEGTFLNSVACEKSGYSREELGDFVNLSGLFKKPMNFDSFKKTFFPHLYLINDDAEESEEEQRERVEKRAMLRNQDRQPEIIQDRLKKLEKMLKERFSNNWDSVRKAFLGLDTDYDGFITVEDILRNFGNQGGAQAKESGVSFNFNDLKKILKEKDSTGEGKLGYADFSKWVGNCIHQSEGFYFRHDSIQNPNYEGAKLKREQQSVILPDDKTILELEKTIIDKIKFQWKTIRKAFIDMNKEKTGAILAEELKFYFEHWGLKLTDEQFKVIFNKFDFDGDGKISYKDFHMTVGSEIHPGETLYFRQDKPHMMRINKCRHDKCWQPTLGRGNFCNLHNKMYVDKAVAVFNSYYAQIQGPIKWAKLIRTIKDQCDSSNDQSELPMVLFETIFDNFGIPMSAEQKSLLLITFPGKGNSNGEEPALVVDKLFEVKYTERLNTVYTKVKISDTDDDEVAVDACGYTGNLRRERPDEKSLVPVHFDFLISLIKKDNQMLAIMRRIKEIDKERNGYVTSTELDDIIKLSYGEELMGKSLKSMFKPYASIQNKILIDYKRFRDDILKAIRVEKAESEAEKKARIVDMLTKRYTASSIAQSKKSNDEVRSTYMLDGDIESLKMRRSQNYSNAKRKNLLMAVKRATGENQSYTSLSQYRQEHINNGRSTAHSSVREIHNSIDSINLAVEGSNSQLMTLNNRPLTHSFNVRRKVQGKSIGMMDTLNSMTKSTISVPYQHQHAESSYFEKDNQRKQLSTIDLTGSYQSLQANQKSTQEKIFGVIRAKLQYEWKNIYRQMTSQSMGEGIVSRKLFEEALTGAGVYLSNLEIKALVDKFGKNSVRYVKYANRITCMHSY